MNSFSFSSSTQILPETHLYASEAKREIRIDKIFGLAGRKHFLHSLKEVRIH